jgi:EAL domain-containing protein (putative c-di-GMP-specific phosphodiesterase class I)
MSAAALQPSRTAVAAAPPLDRELKADRDRFVAFAFAFADLLIEVGPEGRIEFAAGAARGLTGREAAELAATPFAELFAPRDREPAERLLAAARGGNRTGAIVLRLAATGAGASVSSCALPGRAVVYVAIAHRAAAAIAGAERDLASGLLAAEPFAEAAAAAVEEARSLRRDVQLSLIRLCGLDALRARAGESAVDALFAEIGAFLELHAVGGAAGRVAEDRCGVVHEAATPLDVAGETAGVLRAGGHPPGIVAVEQRSIGLDSDGLAPPDAAKALAFTLRRFADNEPLELGTLGEAFRALADDTLSRVEHFRGVVSDDNFDVAFQPIVRLADGRVEHYEVLARIDAGRSPLEVIRFAEGVGMIEWFDLSVCGRALEHLRAAPGAAPIAVNLSGGSLQSPGFVMALLGLLERAAIPGRRLLFEITESAQITDLAPVRHLVERLRGLGHAVCLDDFGAGAASFAYLQALPVDYVKIDGSYIGRICESARDRAIVRAIAGMCRDLGIRTIAEMIESEAQLDLLQELGIDLGQGYLFGRPQPRPAAPRQRP